MQFHIENMTCAGCARGVAKAIQSVDPAAKVLTDPTRRFVDVVSDQPRLTLEAVLANAGYPATETRHGRRMSGCCGGH